MDPLDSLIAVLRDCPGSPESWQRFLEQAATMYDCTLTGFTRWSEGTRNEVFLSVGFDEASQIAYRDHFGRINPWVIEFDRKYKDHNVVLPTEAWVPETTFGRSEFYNDYMRLREGSRHGATATIQSGATKLHLSLVRSYRRGAFAEEQIRSLERLVPHLRNAIAADGQAAQLRAECAVIRESLDLLPQAVVVLARPLFTNLRAREMFARWPHVFCLSSDSLRIGSVAADAALQRRLTQAAALESAVDPPFILRLSRNHALRVTVVAGFAAAQWALKRPPLVVIEDYQPSQSIEAALALSYGLTPREAELSVALQGNSLREAADLLGISVKTARVHLAHAFRKAGVHSQRALAELTEKIAVADGHRQHE